MDNERNKQQEKILELLKESWEDFKAYYKSEKDIYSKNDVKGHLVCWKEDDIVLQLSRFFYKRLSNRELKGEHIEIHSQTDISEIKFGEEYSFNKKISELNKKLGRKKGTKPDFIITKEDDTGSLWLIGEVKYFRSNRDLWYFPKYGMWQWEERVEKDIKELNVLKDLKICIKTVYLVADAYLHENNETQWKNLIEKLKKERLKLDYLDLIIMCDKKTNKCIQNDFIFNS